MTRGELEAKVWAITGRNLTGSQVDAIVDAAEAYTAERLPRKKSRVVVNPVGTELYPVISVLARAMLGDEAGADIREYERDRKRAQRERLALVARAEDGVAKGAVA